MTLTQEMIEDMRREADVKPAVSGQEYGDFIEHDPQLTPKEILALLEMQAEETLQVIDASHLLTNVEYHLNVKPVIGTKSTSSWRVLIP